MATGVRGRGWGGCDLGLGGLHHAGGRGVLDEDGVASTTQGLEGILGCSPEEKGEAQGRASRALGLQGCDKWQVASRGSGLVGGESSQGEGTVPGDMRVAAPGSVSNPNATTPERGHPERGHPKCGHPQTRPPRRRQSPNTAIPKHGHRDRSRLRRERAVM